MRLDGDVAILLLHLLAEGIGVDWHGVVHLRLPWSLDRPPDGQALLFALERKYRPPRIGVVLTLFNNSLE
jgi:hypothetical protein